MVDSVMKADATTDPTSSVLGTGANGLPEPVSMVLDIDLDYVAPSGGVPDCTGRVIT